MLPLIVDLDGTLIKSDVTAESLLILLRRNPFYFFLMLGWWLIGKQRLKHEVAQRVDLDTAHLPLRYSVLSYIKSQKSIGRKIILATASHRKYAEQIAASVGLFDEVLASDQISNLSGQAKARVLVERFGDKGFDYMGNAHPDLFVWKKSANALVVGASEHLLVAAKKIANVSEVLEPQHLNSTIVLRQLRVRQWVKNALIAVPMITSVRLFSLSAWLHVLPAILAFSLCAGSGYVINDLLDVFDDRQHKTKSERPIPSGDLSILDAMILVPILLCAAFLIAAFLGRDFVSILLLYFVSTLIYSLYVKRWVAIDVVVLAMLYTLRIFAGAIVIQSEVSFWLLAFSMFIFLSLALLKRYIELIDLRLHLRQDGHVLGRSYQVSDIELLAALGGGCGYISVLVFALYINSNDVLGAYASPQLLWLLCPVLMFWISRVWILAHRGQLQDDPVVWASHDVVTYLTLAVVIAIMLAATLSLS